MTLERQEERGAGFFFWLHKNLNLYSPNSTFFFLENRGEMGCAAFGLVLSCHVAPALWLAKALLKHLLTASLLEILVLCCT